MCGLFGYAIKEWDPRIETAMAILACMNESRGRDAFGWSNGRVIVKDAFEITQKFNEIPMQGELVGAFHTRQGTTGPKHGQDTAHPWEIGKIIGMHNGFVHNHFDLNKKYDRSFKVDSQHVVAHLAEGLSLKDVDFNGVFVYFEDGEGPFMFRTTARQFEVARLAGELGIVWSSEWRHLMRALDMVKLGIASNYALPVPERVHILSAEGLQITDEKIASYEAPPKPPNRVVGFLPAAGHSGNYSPGRGNAVHRDFSGRFYNAHGEIIGEAGGGSEVDDDGFNEYGYYMGRPNSQPSKTPQPSDKLDKIITSHSQPIRAHDHAAEKGEKAVDDKEDHSSKKRDPHIGQWREVSGPKDTRWSVCYHIGSRKLANIPDMYNCGCVYNHLWCKSWATIWKPFGEWRSINGQVQWYDCWHLSGKCKCQVYNKKDAPKNALERRSEPRIIGITNSVLPVQQGSDKTSTGPESNN